MIFNVIWSMFLFRGAASALGNLPYDSGAFVSIGIGNLLDGLSHETLEFLEGLGLLLHIGVMLVFLVIVVHSKHLHIFVAPVNVMFGRQPMALGAVKPMMSGGKPVALDDLEELDEDAKLGIGAVEDFTWKGLLDFATCTECGRCQSQCPAWNTEKPLSPKMLIMDLRDHAFAKAPYILADESAREGLSDEVKQEAARPLIGDEAAYGVIDPDVLWSCTNCGACVNQCPVDIEHVDHIIDMRRYQVLVENNFPAELNQLFKGLEGKGNPWNMSATMPDGLGQGPRLRRARGRRGPRVAGVGRLAVLGRLRRRLRGPRQEDHPGRGRAAQHGRHLVRRARQRRDLHRRPGPARRQRVRLPGPGAAERRDPHRAPRSSRSSPPAPTASTRSRTSTATSASSSRSCTTPSCSTGWCARAS